jgi:hypothetical protein
MMVESPDYFSILTTAALRTPLAAPAVRQSALRAMGFVVSSSFVKPGARIGQPAGSGWTASPLCGGEKVELFDSRLAVSLLFLNARHK